MRVIHCCLIVLYADANFKEPLIAKVFCFGVKQLKFINRV